MPLKTETEIKPKHDAVLITGDAWTLEMDLEAFYKLHVSHETFCINRSVFAPWVRTRKHWGAADADEAAYMAKQVRDRWPTVLRHTLKPGPEFFNVQWHNGDGEDINEWQGGSLRMAIEICDAIGYNRIMLAGCPILYGGHWYDRAVKVEWTRDAIAFWQNYKNERVKSMSGFTRYIFGGPEDWNL